MIFVTECWEISRILSLPINQVHPQMIKVIFLIGQPGIGKSTLFMGLKEARTDGRDLCVNHIHNHDGRDYQAEQNEAVEKAYDNIDSISRFQGVGNSLAKFFALIRRKAENEALFESEDVAFRAAEYTCAGLTTAQITQAHGGMIALSSNEQWPGPPIKITLPLKAGSKRALITL